METAGGGVRQVRLGASLSVTNLRRPKSRVASVIAYSRAARAPAKRTVAFAWA
jgi:hypothetical protein